MTRDRWRRRSASAVPRGSRRCAGRHDRAAAVPARRPLSAPPVGWTWQLLWRNPKLEIRNPNHTRSAVVDGVAFSDFGFGASDFRFVYFRYSAGISLIERTAMLR